MSQMDQKPPQPGPSMMQMNMGMTMGGQPMGMPQGVIPRGAPAGAGPPPGIEERKTFHTYIYDYFIKHEYYDCASVLLKTPGFELNVHERSTSPQRRQKQEGDSVMNGVDDMDTDGPKHEDGEGPKSGKDFPTPAVPQIPGSFLFDWWLCFMDIFLARSGGQRASHAANQYAQNTQAAQRIRQEQLRQHQLSQGMMGGPGSVPSNMMNAPGYPGARMMPGMVNGVMRGQEGAEHNKSMLQHAAINNARNGRPQPPMMGPQQKMMGQMPGRPEGDMNDMNGPHGRPQSPAAQASPGGTKRIRLENGEYQPVNQPRPQGMPPGSSGQNATQASQLLIASGINPNQLSQAQFAQFQGQSPANQQRSINMYAQSVAAATGRNLQLQSGGPMKPGMQGVQHMPQHGGSPMMPQTSEGSMPEFYNQQGGAMRPGQIANAQTGNHALQDYQMQLMLLEQQNKKRLMMARQEQNDLQHSDGGQRPQGGFQSMSPGSSRAQPSPGPGGKPQMAGTPKMQNPGGPGSPMPDAQMGPGHMQQGNSPASGFNGQMSQDGHPNMMYNMKDSMGMMGNANAGGPPNGPMMRPPSSHPQFNGGGQITPEMAQQMNMRAQQGGRGQPGAGGIWAGGPGQGPQQHPPGQMQLGPGQGQPQPPPQGAPTPGGQPGGPQQATTPQQVGTPQQGPGRQLPHSAMPPPQAPAGAPANAARTAPASPQVTNQQPPTPTQQNKAAPKTKAAQGNKKPRAKKGTQAPNAATPVSVSEPPTPTTPVTPVHRDSFNAARPNHNYTSVPNVANQPGQPPQPAANAVPAVPSVASDAVPAGGMGDFGDNFSLQFPELTDGNDTNLLDNFDFDSFLNTEGDNNGMLDNFQWDAVEAGTETT